MRVKEKASYPLFSLEGKHLENVEMNFNFIEKNSKYLIHRAFTKQSTEARYGNASTKTRREVKGGGRKPWRQKGTGRARAGSIRSPLWQGGGVIFGPKPREYSVKLNRKEFKLALQTAIYNARFKISLCSDFTEEIKFPKTKYIQDILHNFGLEKTSRVLIVVDHKTQNLLLSCRNLPKVHLISSSQLNIKELLYAKHILLTKKALDNIQEVYYD
uniref:Large ribosomal subunit protein uL4c n=1 Tax=Sciadococcus taiwanensis TaxID=3028030 RepID=A0A9Y1I2C6_9RHOD|nr:ribosomal protein L4 [Sciadococcus taiwanensis]